MTNIRRHRRSIRLKDYDYASPGAYFVTVCTHDRECLFGEIVDGQMMLNENGLIVVGEWERASIIREEIEIDSFVVMPNHLHGIVIIKEKDADSNVGASGRTPLLHGPAPKSLGSLITGFKSSVTKRVNILRRTPGAPLWQRGFYEHVIRDTDNMNLIREYIITNPARWALDLENPELKT